MCQEKLVQEAVDTLLDNGIRGQPMWDGHSVIVVGSSLSLHRCGLPRKIAIELFQTFVIRGLIRQHLASNIGVAKSKIRHNTSQLDTAIQLQPVFAQWIQNTHTLALGAMAPSATVSTNLTWGGGFTNF
ncbi:hypothetical protein GOBAR_DD29422 [Gossypium barbadense]|nr:hypothetical protein GOBAR_DD29422 [Gossypium barbadense]